MISKASEQDLEQANVSISFSAGCSRRSVEHECACWQQWAAMQRPDCLRVGVIDVDDLIARGKMEVEANR
jgi:hypothetical protein